MHPYLEVYTIAQGYRLMQVRARLLGNSHSGTVVTITMATQCFPCFLQVGVGTVGSKWGSVR